MMRTKMVTFLRLLASISRRKRRVVLAAVDLVLLTLVVWALLSVRYWTTSVPVGLETLLLALAGPVLTVGVFLLLRVYHIVARYLGFYGAIRLGACVVVGTALWATLLLLVGQQGIPRTVVLAYAVVGTMAVVTVRLLAANVLSGIGINVQRRWRDSQAQIPVLIYGTGELAVQLGQTTRKSRTRKLIGYVDSSSAMIGRYIGRNKVYRLSKIQSLIQDSGVEEIYIADPLQTASERRSLLKSLEQYKLRVRLIPDLESLASGRISLSQLRGIQAKDLLGREEVPPNEELIAASIRGKTVLVTGAGGSIGSQLSLRIVALGVKRLILLDNSEIALHQIEQSTREVMAELETPPECVSVLGSVQNVDVIEEVLREYDVESVFHTAAFKHVPIVEKHPLAGIANNVLATELLARACVEHHVERFVLVSTDKAVRPASVMGATKRLAELIIQGFATTQKETIFTAVRFGNVLESSGSVVGIFRHQINSGGPVTVTDRNVVRYFMSLEEATNLVLQAAGMAVGGEVFVLDMGLPVKIDDLARSMIRLMGLEERTPDNPEGDIEISYIGLRRGEKLVEELVIAEQNASDTQHPRIWKSHEPSVDPEALAKELELLKSAVRFRSVAMALTSLSRIIEGYTPAATRREEVRLPEKIVLH